MSEEVKIEKIKKEKVKTKPQKKKDDNKSSNWSVILIIGILSIGLAIGAYFILLSQEKKALDQGEKITVYVANDNIAKGTAVTENMFTTKSVIAELVPENAKNINNETLKGDNFINVDLNKNGILTASMLTPVAEKGDREVGIATNAIANAVNGIVRTSDYIDIYIIPDDFDASEKTYEEKEYEVTDVDKDTGEVSTHTETTMVEAGTTNINFSITPAFQHVYVSKAFDKEGKIIPGSDVESVVSNFNIVLNLNDANYLIGALQNATVYVTKCKDNKIEGYISNVTSTIDNNLVDITSISENSAITVGVAETEEAEEDKNEEKKEEVKEDDSSLEETVKETITPETTPSTPVPDPVAEITVETPAQ